MGANQQALLAENAAGGVATDPNFSSVVLLCHFDGVNNQTTTVDSSASAKTLTRAVVTLSTAQVKWGTASSNSSSGGTSYWSTPDSTDWDFSNGQFTIECWVHFASAPGSTQRAVASQWFANGNLSWFFGLVSSQLAFYYTTNGTAASSVAANWTPSTGVWYHIAADRDASNVLRVYLDGAVHASATVSATIFNSSAELEICGSLIFSGMNGYIDDLRITKGVARYGGAFSVPTAAFPDS